MNLLKEFREFIARGNVVDLAVGVVIGGAFGSIVNSLVKDIFMPPIGYLISGIDFSNLKIILHDPYTTLDATGKAIEHPAVAIAYGSFLSTLLSFLIISTVIFLVVKAINVLKRWEAEKPKPTPELTTQEKLLTEIRDLLSSSKA